MQLVQVNEVFSFNYTAYDQADDLYVAFQIYDISSDTPVFLDQVQATYSAFGSYLGNYTAAINKSYGVIGLVYTDNTYSTVDTSRAPSADVFQTFGNSVLYLPFLYSAFDQAGSLYVRASIYNMTSGSPSLAATANMTEIDFGVYFGSYVGTSLNTYAVIGVVYTSNSYATPDYNYAPSSDSFDCIQSGLGVIGAAYLTSTYSNSSFSGPHIPKNVVPPIILTQGNTAVLYLTAVDSSGIPVDLTGASITSYINAPNGAGIAEFGNSQHTVNPDQVNYEGQFTLTLSEADTASLGVGDHKEILSVVTIGSVVISFRGFNVLGVLAGVPLE